MATLAITWTFANNTTADGTQVNTNFSDVVTYINDRNSGSAVWEYVKATTSAGVPLTINNSTGSNSIAIFQDNGSAVFTVADGGDVYLKATGKLYLDGGSNTYITESSGDVITLYAGGQNLGNFTKDASSNSILRLLTANTASPYIGFCDTDANDMGYIQYKHATDVLEFAAGATAIISMSSVNFSPIGTGTISSGDSGNYWNDISYKTLTDRGCLGWFDDGVELQDGKKVSDCEALLLIKKHPTKKTIYGVEMLDYKTFPKVSYKKAEKNGVLLERDNEDNPIGGSDGIEMTSMFSIMIGAIKELAKRVKELENKK